MYLLYGSQWGWKIGPPSGQGCLKGTGNFNSIVIKPLRFFLGTTVLSVQYQKLFSYTDLLPTISRSSRYTKHYKMWNHAQSQHWIQYWHPNCHVPAVQSNLVSWNKFPTEIPVALLRFSCTKPCRKFCGAGQLSLQVKDSLVFLFLFFS